MAIPDYQSFMLPLLRQLTDGREHRLTDVREQLASEFALTPEEREELLPSGTQRLFFNRVGWAQTYLKKAGLLDNPKRGILVLTERGREVLVAPPEAIDVAFLSQFPEFQTFVTGGPREGQRAIQRSNERVSDVENETPEELLETAHQKLRQELASELLTTIKGNSPAFFERLVVDLLVKMGYGGSRREAG